MIDTDLPHKILSLLKRGHFMRSEIARYCSPVASDVEVWIALNEMESQGVIRYLSGVGLYGLTTNDMSTGETPHG